MENETATADADASPQASPAEPSTPPHSSVFVLGSRRRPLLAPSGNLPKRFCVHPNGGDDDLDLSAASPRATTTTTTEAIVPHWFAQPHQLVDPPSSLSPLPPPRRGIEPIVFDINAINRPVDRRQFRRVGPYILGPKIGHCPMDNIKQYLAKREGTDHFVQLKMLTLCEESLATAEQRQEEKHCKMLLHTELTMLALLAGQEGVIQSHGLFKDQAYEEITPDSANAVAVQTGRVRRRVVLVLDCVWPHEFSARSQAYVNLQQHLIKVKRMNDRAVLPIFRDIVATVERMHARGVIHRDLKLGNIQLNVLSNRVVITNFCLGKHLHSDADKMFDQRGSPAYISPEVLTGRPYAGRPIDVWSLGVMLYMMVFGQFPFYEASPSLLFKKIKTADYQIPAALPGSAQPSYDTVKLIAGMLALDPERRMTATQVREQLDKILRTQRRHKASEQTVPASAKVVVERKERHVVKSNHRVASAATAVDDPSTAWAHQQLPTIRLVYTPGQRLEQRVPNVASNPDAAASARRTQRSTTSQVVSTVVGQLMQRDPNLPPVMTRSRRRAQRDADVILAIAAGQRHQTPSTRPAAARAPAARAPAARAPSAAVAASNSAPNVGVAAVAAVVHDANGTNDPFVAAPASAERQRNFGPLAIDPTSTYTMSPDAVMRRLAASGGGGGSPIGGANGAQRRYQIIYQSQQRRRSAPDAAASGQRAAPVALVPQPSTSSGRAAGSSSQSSTEAAPSNAGGASAPAATATATTAAVSHSWMNTMDQTILAFAHNHMHQQQRQQRHQRATTSARTRPVPAALPQPAPPAAAGGGVESGGRQQLFAAVGEWFARRWTPTHSEIRAAGRLPFDNALPAAFCQRICVWLLREFGHTELVNRMLRVDGRAASTSTSDASLAARQKFCELLRQCGVAFEERDGDYGRVLRRQPPDVRTFLICVLQANAYDVTYFCVL